MILPTGATACVDLLGPRSETTSIMGADCARHLTTNGPTLICTWRYEYRDPQADLQLDIVDSHVTTCLPNAQALQSPKPVNHPDTHTVRHYAFDGAEIMISLKDKAQHGETLVFLTLPASK